MCIWRQAPIASASAGRTPCPDLVTMEKSYSSISLVIGLSSTVITSSSGGRSKKVTMFTEAGHGNSLAFLNISLSLSLLKILCIKGNAFRYSSHPSSSYIIQSGSEEIDLLLELASIHIGSIDECPLSPFGTSDQPPTNPMLSNNQSERQENKNRSHRVLFCIKNNDRGKVSLAFQRTALY